MTDTTPADELLIEAASNYASKYHDGENCSDLMNAYFAGAAWQARAALSQQAEPVDAHESTRMYHFAIKREQRLRELIGLVVEHVESPDHDGGISNALRQRLIDEMAAPPAVRQAEPVAWIEYGPEGKVSTPETILRGFGVSTIWHTTRPAKIGAGNGLLMVCAAPPATQQAEPVAIGRIETDGTYTVLAAPPADEAVRLLREMRDDWARSADPSGEAWVIAIDACLARANR
jgi:hypothetical protein